jgi:hypothetical protein
MFGYPAGFIRGQMFTGLFQTSMILRLSPQDRETFLKQFATKLFEPMPGRVMREYVVVPKPLFSSSKTLEQWLAKASEYASSLPAKKTRAKTAARNRKKTR